MTVPPAAQGLPAVPLLAMGCRWSLELDGVPEDEAERMRERWSRCTALASTPEALVLDAAPTPVRVVPAGAPLASEDPVAEDVGQAVLVPLHGTAQLAYDLSRAITRRGIERLRGTGPLLLHAAAVSSGDRAVVLVAQSGGGKSTAARQLSRSFGYVTDESVVITQDDQIAPYPKPPSLIVDPARPGDKEEPPPDEVGMLATPQTVRLGSLLGLSRDPEVTTPQIVQVDLAQHLLELIPETSSLWLNEHGLDRLARAATAGGPPAQLRYSEIDECVDLLREHLAQARPAEPSWVHLPPREGTALREVQLPPIEGAPGGRITTGSTVVRAPWSDALDADGALVILQGSAVFCVEALLRAVWLVTEEPLTIPEVVDAVVALEGPHPEAEELVLQAVHALFERKLVLPFAAAPSTPTEENR